MGPRKLVLKSHYSLGDIVLMTAAVRDLHRCYPRQFVTDVRTSCAGLWEQNPYLTPLDERARAVKSLTLDYPLINYSNQVPYHSLHAYIDALNEKLGLDIHGTEFKGDIHLSEMEKSAPSQVAEVVGQEIPFWLISAGGKDDLTIKWWDFDRYQEVVDHFGGRIQFVQVGAQRDFHPKLRSVIDLRGRTSTRQLVRLMHHAQGVLCGVTGLMHLAAAVETKTLHSRVRPCVVVAGGREPSHWEAYPFHQFIHNVGTLPCCANGGCWKSRTYPLGDNAAKDQNLCTNPVGLLPRCMDLISAAEVIHRIEAYFLGGQFRYLNRSQARTAVRGVGNTRLNAFDHQPLHSGTARPTLERVVRQLPERHEPSGHGRGIVICAGGVKYFTSAWVCIQMLRHLGCTLPVELWHLGPQELDARMAELMAPLGVTCVDAFEVRRRHPSRILRGWELKPYALLHSSFQEVLLLDADNVPVADPTPLFDTIEYRRTGALFWPDIPASTMPAAAWNLCGMEEQDERPFETGQIVLDKHRSWRALQLTMWFNEHSDFWYPYTLGDKETFHLAWRKLAAPFAMPRRAVVLKAGAMLQYDFGGRLLFQHRNQAKWSLTDSNRRLARFRFERECLAFLDQLRDRWNMEVQPPAQTRDSGTRGPRTQKLRLNPGARLSLC